MIVGCIAVHDGCILLCKRAIEPRRGYWTLPAGFLELGESAVQGAVRETAEEAGAQVSVIAPYAHFDVPHIGQAYILYRAALRSPSLAPGPESLEAALLPPAAIPWREIAFPAVRVALELIEQDLASGRFRCHQGVLVREHDGFALRDHLQVSLAQP